MALYPDACQRQVLPLWTEWMGIFEQPNQSDKVHATFLSALQGGGWMRHNEAGEKFLKVIVHTAISAAAEAEGAAAEGGKMPVAFGPLDALSKLVVLMMKNVPSEPGAEGSAAEGAKAKAQLQLLARVLSIVLGHLLRHYSAAITQSRPDAFNQRVYLRLLGSWLFDMVSPDPALDPVSHSITDLWRA